MTMANFGKLCATGAVMFLSSSMTLGQSIELDLNIGYPNEGRLNTSPKACAAFVKESTNLSNMTVGEFEQIVANVCAARVSHIAAHDRLQSSYKQLASAAIMERRIRLSTAVENLKSVVKTCLDFKHALRFSGHQYHGDIIENNIAADCLNLSNDLLRPEIDRLTEINKLAKTIAQPTEPAAPLNLTKQKPSPTSYIGKWYSDDKSECKGKPGEPGSPLVYTAKRIFGQEFACDVVRAIPRGPATELSLSCSGEGESYKESETVEVVEGRLRRATIVNGKRRTFTYSRCP
jgi:hypothetical protein